MLEILWIITNSRNRDGVSQSSLIVRHSRIPDSILNNILQQHYQVQQKRMFKNSTRCYESYGIIRQQICNLMFSTITPPSSHYPMKYPVSPPIYRPYPLS